MARPPRQPRLRHLARPPRELETNAEAVAELEATLQTMEEELARQADQVAQGVLPEGARRPLNAAEEAARVNFRSLVEQIERRQAEVARLLVDERRWLADQVRGLLAAQPDTGQISWRIYDLGSPARPLDTDLPGATVRAAQLEAAVRIQLEDAAREGMAQVVNEALAQGVPAELAPLPPSVRNHLESQARMIAVAPHSSGIDALRSAASQVPYVGLPVGEAADRLAQAVAETRLAGLETDSADGPVAHAAGLGRASQAQQLPRPDRIYASELNDNATCGPCSLIDGTEYATLEAAQRDYPQGFYAHCDGGQRCRGTLVFVWPTEAPPTQELPGDEPPPPFPPPGMPLPPDALPPAPGDWRAAVEAELRGLRLPEVKGGTLDNAAGSAWRRDATEAERTARRVASLPTDEALAADAAMVRIGSHVDAEVQRRLEAALPSQVLEANRSAIARGDFTVEELHRITVGGESGQVYREVLAELRPMGLPAGHTGPWHDWAKGSSAPAKATVDAALVNYPTAWAEASRAGGTLKAAVVRRGYYTEAARPANVAGWMLQGQPRPGGTPARIALSGIRSGAKGAQAGAHRVATHELGHRMEDVYREGLIRRLEWTHHHQRTTNADGTRQPTRWLGPPYGRKETGREDQYPTAYTGKEYGGGPADYTEVVATGMESLFAGSSYLDAELRRWLLGVLAAV